MRYQNQRQSRFSGVYLVLEAFQERKCWRSPVSFTGVYLDFEVFQTKVVAHFCFFLARIKMPLFTWFMIQSFAVRPVECPHFWLYGKKTTLLAFLRGNEKDSWTTETAFWTHFWMRVLWGVFCYKIVGKRTCLTKMWALSRSNARFYGC